MPQPGRATLHAKVKPGASFRIVCEKPGVGFAGQIQSGAWDPFCACQKHHAKGWKAALRAVGRILPGFDGSPGNSGLGLDAQRKLVSDYLNGGNWVLSAELTEVESGKRSD